MREIDDDQPLAAFLAAVSVGDTVAEFTRSGATVFLEGFADDPVGLIGSLDLSWKSFRRSVGETLQPGTQVFAEVIAIDLPRRKVLLSRTATENPELWAFLKALRLGQRLSGIVTAIEHFGIFIDLDDGPKHPVFPGVGFITMPELSWLRFEDPSDIVSTGQRVTCEVLAFDTINGEARLSLRATQPDPFQRFARDVQAGQILHGLVTKLVPFGAFVHVGDGVEGLIHLSGLSTSPIETPDQAVQVGDEIAVTVTEIDLPRRRLSLSRHHGSTPDE